MVFHLPMPDTATLARAPSWAIHSRSAETVISRPMIRCRDDDEGACVVPHQQHESRGDHQLVDDRIEELP